MEQIASVIAFGIEMTCVALNASVEEKPERRGANEQVQCRQTYVSD